MTPPTPLDLDYFGPTKLFKCIEDQAWDVVLRRIERMPQEAQVWIVRRAFDESIIWRRLPIHEALIHSAPTTVVEALLDAYPDGAKDKDSSHRLAIHYACEHHASVDAIKRLLRSYPDGAKVKDSDSCLAIHYAYKKNASIDIIKQLLIAHPACLDEDDELGNSPGKYLEGRDDILSFTDVHGEKGSTSIENNESKGNTTANYIMIQVLKQELTGVQEQLSVSQRTEEIVSHEHENLKAVVDELILIRLQLESKVENNEQEMLKLKESNDGLISELASLNTTLSERAEMLDVSAKKFDELHYKLMEVIDNAAENERRLLSDKDLELSSLKELHMRELLSTQESHRSIFDDLNTEFNAYKETRSSQIDSLVAAQNLLMANIKTQESEITLLRDEVEKRNLEIKRHEDLADKAHRRAETLTSKLKEAVDEIQKATNCILEERQTNAELELEMEIAVKSLQQLETRNQTLEDEAKFKEIELNTVKEENEKLVEQIKGAQADLSFQTTELENARCYSDELQRQLYEVVDKCENAVKIVEDQQTDINNLTNDLKVKEENIMLLEDQICDIKISHHVVQEDSANKDKELHVVKEGIEKLSHHIKGAQADLSFQTTELENARRHSDELQRQLYEVVDKYENAVKIIKDQQIVVNNLENDLKVKDDSIMLLKEQMYELKISHRTAQEDSVSLAKTLKLINLCLLSTDSNEGRLHNGNRANIPEDIARNNASDERFMILGQSFINEKQWRRVSSPSNTKDSSFKGEDVSKDLKSKPIYRSVQSETPTFNESRFDFDGDKTVKEEGSQFYSYSMRSPPPSPSSRNVSNLAQSVGQREDSVMTLSRMIQDLSSDRRGSMDIEQAHGSMPKYD